MIYVSWASILLYYSFFLHYYTHLIPPEKSRRVQIALSLLAVIVAYMLMQHLDLRWMNIVAVMTAMVVGLRFSTGMNWVQSLYGGGTCVLSAYCFRGIFTAFVAFVAWRGNPNYLNDNYAYYNITMIILLLALVFFWLLRATIFPDDKIKRFLYSREPLKLVVVYQVAAAINLTVMNMGRFLETHFVWYIEVALGACVLTLGMLIYCVYYSIRVTDLMEYEWRSSILEEQYARQLRHYKSYQKYTESFRAFQHDYKAMMTSLKLLIREHQNDKAIELIDDMYDTMQRKVHVHKKYSDHVVLDAMLQDLANLCEEKQIRFLFQVFVPRNTNINLLDAVRIFSNLTNNAVEACCKLPPENRFIEITSKNENGWATLQVVNSFDGTMKKQNGRLLTTKKEKDCHGMGMVIVKEIVESRGGMVHIETDFENKQFQVRVHIPHVVNPSET